MSHLEITREPPAEDREAILAAVRALLEREAAQARPSAWTLAGWVHRRAGVTDLRRWLGARAWTLSSRLPGGGREYPGLVGRGDAK